MRGPRCGCRAAVKPSYHKAFGPSILYYMYAWRLAVAAELGAWQSLAALGAGIRDFCGYARRFSHHAPYQTRAGTRASYLRLLTLATRLRPGCRILSTPGPLPALRAMKVPCRITILWGHYISFTLFMLQRLILFRILEFEPKPIR